MDKEFKFTMDKKDCSHRNMFSISGTILIEENLRFGEEINIEDIKMLKILDEDSGSLFEENLNLLRKYINCRIYFKMTDDNIGSKAIKISFG